MRPPWGGRYGPDRALCRGGWGPAVGDRVGHLAVRFTEWGYGRDYADTTAVDITRRALDLGINLVDTAEIYGFGRSERILGRALGDRRDEAFIATKVFPVLPLGPIVEQRARASARRLGVDVIDLYQLHWPNPVVPLEATMAGMRRLLDRGVVRHAGVSNFGLGRWQHADRALGRPVLSNQVEYSLVARRAEAKLLPWAQANDRIIIAYSPLAQGFLSARWDGTTDARRRPFEQPVVPPREPRARSGSCSTPCVRSPRPRRHPGASGVGVADPQTQRRRHPGREQRRAARSAMRPRPTSSSPTTTTSGSPTPPKAFEPITGPAAIPSLLRARLPGASR